MSATLAAAALGAAGNIAGGTISTLGQLFANKQNIDLAHQQMQWNERMMDKQNQQELDFWNKQNEYNSPAAQVQRMHEAGLYAGDTANTPAQSLNAASPLGYSNPNVQNPFSGIGNGISAAARNAAEIENIKADTKYKESEAKGQDIDNLFKPKVYEQQLDINGRKIKLDENLTEAQIDKMRSDIELQQEQNAIAWKNADTASAQEKLNENKFFAEQFWQAVYYEIDKYKLDQTDRQLAIAAIEAATHSRAVDYEHMDRQANIIEMARHNGVTEAQNQKQIELAESKLGEQIREFNKTNARNNAQFYTGLGMKLAGVALLCIPGCQLAGAGLLGSGFLMPGKTQPASNSYGYNFSF